MFGDEMLAVKDVSLKKNWLVFLSDFSFFVLPDPWLLCIDLYICISLRWCIVLNRRVEMVQAKRTTRSRVPGTTSFPVKKA